MGLKTELNQHQKKKSKQTEDQAKSPNNDVNIQHLCRQKKQFIENENIHQKLEKNIIDRSGQNQEVSSKSCRESKSYLLKIFGEDEKGRYDKENEKESEKEGDDTIQDEHLEQDNVMVIKSPPFDKNKDQKEIPVKHKDENFCNKISLKQRKDQENLHQIRKNQKCPDLNSNLKDAELENKCKIGDDLQSKQIDNKDAYDSVTNPEKFPWEEETYVKMLPGGDENEDGNSIEKSYWETDGTGRCDSMDSLGFKTKLNIVTALCAVPRDSNRLQEDVEKRFNTTFPRVVGHAVSQMELSMLCNLHEKEMKPVVTEAMADLCRMEGDYTEVFEVPSVLSGELSTVTLCAKLGRSIGNSVSLTVYGKPKEDCIEKHEVDVLEHEKEKFTEQLENPKLMNLAEELVCLLEEMKTYMSAVEERMEKAPIHIFGLTDGRQHYDLPRHSNSGRGHSSSGKSQSGSPPDNTATGGDHQGSDRGKNKKDFKKDEGPTSGEKDNPEVNSPTVLISDTRVPPLDFKSYRRKHGGLSIHELTMYLGYLGNLQVPSQEEAPPWQLHQEVNSCLEMVVDNLDPIPDEALSCQICVTLSSHLKHFADCLLPYTSSCLVCRQIFMFICVHVKTCIDKTANLRQQKQQPQQQLAQICTVSLCQKITSFVSADVDKLYRTLSHIWPRVKKTLAGLLRSEEIWDPQSTEFPFPVKIPLGPRTSGKISTALPSIPEHESLPSSSSCTSIGCETFSNQVSAQSREGEEHDEGEEPVVDPSMVLGTAGDGDNSLEQPQNSVSESNSSSFSGRIYYDEAPSSLPNVHIHQSRGQLLSLIDRPMGTPGIGEVVYGNKWQLVKVAKIWGNLKLQYQMEGHLALHYREEGVILSEYKKQLQIMKTRYQENFQYEKLVHLGNGMSGKCHLAQDWNTDYKFCLKKIHISHYEEKEIEIWSELEYAYIVKLYGAIRLGEMVFILAEFIDGGCLTEAINTQRNLNCRLGHRLALHYFKQLLQVLCYLRNKNILHEDLKADNILLSQNDRSIRVADFGLARRITHQKKGEQPFGTQTQWSPEKAGSEGHGFPSEVWAAVCVLVHMLSGYPPWVRRFSDAKLLHFVIVQNSPPIQDIPKNVHPVIQDLIVQGLELDPGKRPTADALLKHKAFTLFESGPPSDQIYSTLLTSSNAAMLPLNHLDENTSILQEIYHSLAIPSVSQGVNVKENSLAIPSVPQGVNVKENSLAIPSVSQGVNGKENSLAIPFVSQGLNVKENSQHRNSIVSLPSQPQRSTSQKEAGAEYGLQSVELSGHLEWLKTWLTAPQVPPDLVAMPVIVNPDPGPFYPPDYQVPSCHFYDYLYDHTTAPQPVPDSTELQVYTPDDVSHSGSSYPSYNLSEEDGNSNLPNFLLLDVDRELENLKQEMGLQVSGSSNSSVFRQEKRAETPDRVPDIQHDSVESFDSFRLFGDGEPTIPTLPNEPTIPTLPKFGDIASFDEIFMLTDTKKPDQQHPCSKCTLPDSEFNEKTDFDRMTEPEKERGVSHQIIPGSAKMQEVKLLQDLSPSAKQQESSQNSSKLDIQPKDQQSYMMRHLSHPIIQTTEYLHPPTQPHTAPPDQKPSKPFPESAVLPRNPSSLQQLRTQIPQRRIDQDKAATFLDTLDSQKTFAVTTAQNMTSFNPPSHNSSSVRVSCEKSEKDLHNELLKQAASERDKTISSRPPLHLDLKRTSKITPKNKEKKAPNTAPATMSRENKEPDEDLMWKSCDEMQIDSISSNTRSTPSPVHTTPKSAYDEQEEAFKRLETESQQSDEILNQALDDDYENETHEQVKAELSIEHDDDKSLQYVVNTYLDEHDQSAECCLSLTFVNQEKETLLKMKVKRQTTQSWQDFIEKEFCQDNSCHDQFRLEMFNFRQADGVFMNLDDDIGDEDKTVFVMEATAHDPWFVEDGMIKH